MQRRHYTEEEVDELRQRAEDLGFETCEGSVIDRMTNEAIEALVKYKI